MKTTQAVRNIRKYKRKIETAPKGRMVTDDYGNKLSVKKKPDGTFGRRHTLSQGKKRAIALGGDSVSDGLRSHKARINTGSFYRERNKTRPSDYAEAINSRRHAVSALRRDYAVDAFSPRSYTNAEKYSVNRIKSDYHTERAKSHNKTHTRQATKYAKQLHYGTKRKPKDFTK